MIFQSVKKYQSNTKQKVLTLYKSKLQSYTLMDYQPKNMKMPLKLDMLDASVRNRKLEIKGYLEKLRPHLYDMISDLKNSGKWKINLSSNLIYTATESNEKSTMYSKSDSDISIISNDTDEIIQEYIDSLLHKYQIDREQFLTGGNFIFDYVSEMHYICNKITLNHDESYIDSSKWIKSKEQLNLTMKNQNKIWR